LERPVDINSGFGQWPYTIRLCFQLLLVILIVWIITAGQAIFVPLYFSVLLSILLLPMANFLEKLKLPKALAALIAVLFALLVIGTIIYLLSAQIITFLNDIPSIKKHLSEHYVTLQHWIKHRFDISAKQQNILFTDATVNVQDAGIIYVKQTFFTMAQTAAFLIFILIYSFLILFYRNTIKNFMIAMFSKPDKSGIEVVISGAKRIIKNYMLGLVIEMIIIATSNAIILTVIGIKYAIFLGVLTGILNIMPFIGIYTGIIITALVTLTTSASMNQIVWIFIGLLGIHFVDTNLLMPRIIGSRVKINALITMLGAIAGGLLLGIAGVFLALPTIAILKIIFDRIEGMRPWAILLGDETEFPGKKIVQKINKKLTFKKPPKMAVIK
jgi:predicted PurR-regulated permease PerM